MAYPAKKETSLVTDANFVQMAQACTNYESSRKESSHHNKSRWAIYRTCSYGRPDDWEKLSDSYTAMSMTETDSGKKIWYSRCVARQSQSESDFNK